jgi:DNA-directed RNA polymerase sigma subunit (sigma70/sigma32)
MKSTRRKDPAPPKTLRQVAEVFGVTKERVRQIQNQALAKLRGVLDEQVFAAQ